MTRFSRTARALSAAALIPVSVAAVAGVATADTVVDSGPSTFNTTTELPIIYTQHGEDGIKANRHNPHPVCNAFEDHRTVITRITERFEAAGAIETTNNTTDRDMPLTQSVERTEKLTIDVSGDFGGEFSGPKLGLKAGISHTQEWTEGQVVGPYTLHPGETGKATYGFKYVEFEGTQQRCLINGTWSKAWPLHGKAPESKAVRVTVNGSTTEDIIESAEAGDTLN